MKLKTAISIHFFVLFAAALFGDVSTTQSVFSAAATSPTGVATGDFDNNGKADIALGDGSVISIYFNSSTTASASITSAVVPITNLKSGDINGDSIADLGFKGNGSIYFLYGSAIQWSGNMLAATDMSKAIVSEGNQFDFGNINGSGTTDLVVGNPDDDTAATNAGNVMVYFDVHFNQEMDLTRLGTAIPQARAGQTLAVANVVGDSHADIIFNDDDTIHVVAGSATLDSLATATVLLTLPDPATALAAGDSNGDGKADIYVGDSANNAIYGFYGSTSLSGNISASSANIIFKGRNTNDGLGSGRILVNTDLDGDGIMDPAFRATQSSNSALNAGTVHIFSGNTLPSGNNTIGGVVELQTILGQLNESYATFSTFVSSDGGTLFLGSKSNGFTMVPTGYPLPKGTLSSNVTSLTVPGNVNLSLSGISGINISGNSISHYVNGSVISSAANTITHSYLITTSGTYTFSANLSNGIKTTVSNSVSLNANDVNKADQTITFAALDSKTFGDTAFDLTGSSNSGLAVTYVSSDVKVATISGNTVTIVGAGSSTITAEQTGNATYNPATSVAQTLTVVKADQTITFINLANVSVGGSAFSLSATSTSGLPVTFSSSDTSVITVSGSTATIVGVGTTTITASQVGNSNYSAATAVTQAQIVVASSDANSSASGSGTSGGGGGGGGGCFLR